MATNLIIIHIGPDFPPYLNDCLKQVQQVIPSLQLHVLLSYPHTELLKPLTFDNISICAIEDIPSTEEINLFQRVSRHNTHFRSGFWKFSSMRFFYLHAYTKWKMLSNVFHIEYDNLIYTDFTPVLPVFKEKQMWAVMDNPSRCIPSFIFFKGYEIQEELLKCMLQLAPLAKNDMETLAVFINSNPDKVGWLPIITNYTGGVIDQKYSEHAERFGMLFDGACLGQYVGGVDPRNAPGDTRGFINESCVFRCDRAVFLMSPDNKPFLNGLSVVNLHIHSKDLNRWRLKISE